LSFEEFCGLIPESTLNKTNKTTLQEAFSVADQDGSGSISAQEYFWWTLQWTSENAGTASGVEEAFCAGDFTGDGQLNLREFAQTVERFGFGSNTCHALFDELDKDRTGTISYRELAASLNLRKGSYSQECKRLLTALSFDVLEQQFPNKDVLSTKFDDTSWTAKDPVEIRTVLVKRMREAQARPYDLWSALLLFCENKRPTKMTSRLTRKQFNAAMRKLLGFQGSTDVINVCFTVMDEDASGEINYDEWLNYINGKPQRMKRTRELRLSQYRSPDAQPLEDVVFTAVLLHRELKRMLVSAQLSALDLISSFDNSEDGTLSRREFLAAMKSIIGDADVWLNTNVKDVCLEIFCDLGGEDKELDIEEFQRWLLQEATPTGTSVKNPAQQGATNAAAMDGQESNRHAPAGCSVASTPPRANSRLAPLKRDPRVEGQSMTATTTPKATANTAVPSTAPPPLPDPENGFMSAHFLGGSTSMPKIDTRLTQTSSLRLAASRAKMAAQHAANALEQADAASRRRMAAAEYAARTAMMAEEEHVKLTAAQFESRRAQARRRTLILERERRETVASQFGDS
jgi:Ca2+-binding EF-hand superfamily protein